jgi:hypothetical protein
MVIRAGDWACEAVVVDGCRRPDEPVSGFLVAQRMPAAGYEFHD